MANTGERGERVALNKARRWAWQEVQVLMEEIDGWSFDNTLHGDTICLSPQACEDHAPELNVVAVLAGEYVEGVGWMDIYE